MTFYQITSSVLTIKSSKDKGRHTYRIMFYLCSIHVSIDKCDQCWSNLLDSRGHYITLSGMFNKLGLFYNICVKNCLIVNGFFISQP